MRLTRAALVISSLLALAPTSIARAADDARGWELLPGATHRFSHAHSASRDAPIVGYAYGPRAELSLGLELGVVAYRGRGHELRLGGSALVASEDPREHQLLPTFTASRDQETLSLAIAWPNALGRPDSTFEWGLAVGHEASRLARGAAPVDPYRPTDIPFGGGGWWLDPDLTLGVPPLTVRVGDRFFANSLPYFVGARVASNLVADHLAEGLLHAPHSELDFRFRVSPHFDAFFGAFAEALVAHDDSALDGVRLRVLAALLAKGRVGEIGPLAAFEAGNGYGVFINRRELRLAIGVQYALW